MKIKNQVISTELYQINNLFSLSWSKSPLLILLQLTNKHENNYEKFKK